MPPFIKDDSALINLTGKVVVVAGGAEGVASSVVRLLHYNAAHVVFGHEAQISRPPYSKQPHDPTTGRVDMVQTNPSSYNQVLQLFRQAFSIHGRIDHAVACHNVFGETHLFGKEDTIENLDIEPELQPIEVNLKGAIYFAKIALTYLQHGVSDEDRSLTFLSSNITLNGIPFGPLYQISMGGILQLMQSLRPLAFTQPKAPVRINVACPGLPAYPCLDPLLIETWKNEGLAVNTPEHVARLVCYMISQNTTSGMDGKIRQLHGCAIICTANHYWEFDEPLQNNIPHFVGEVSWKTINGTRELYKRLNLPVWRTSEPQ